MPVKDLIWVEVTAAIVEIWGDVEKKMTEKGSWHGSLVCRRGGS